MTVPTDHTEGGRAPVTQADQVLDAARQRGAQGVHTFELRRAYIGNPSQRIAELEQRGHRFTKTREKLNGEAVGTRYVLVHDAEAAAPAKAPGSPAAAEPLHDETVALFDLDATAPTSAIYDAA